MNVIPSVGFGLRDRPGPGRAGIAAPPGGAMSLWQGHMGEGATRVTLGQRDDGKQVYRDPRVSEPTLGAGRLWSSPVGRDDTVSALMARNRSQHSYQMSDQWRGLGGALLNGFGKTGESFSQTMADDSTVTAADFHQSFETLSPAEQVQRSADILATQKADLTGVTAGAQTAGLRVRTRSGDSVELKISVNSGTLGTIGMKVELEASGHLDVEERAAVAELANGLDRALEGLGRDDAIGLDLEGLMRYDTRLISSIDLTASNPGTHQPLHTFALHLGDDQQSIALDGSDGQLNLVVDAPRKTGRAPAGPHASIQRTLEHMDAAGRRGHANDALVQQMKSAFAAFQVAAAGRPGEEDGEPATAPTSQADATTSPSRPAGPNVPVHSPVAPASSGLADFSISASGETHRRNRFGSHHEAGRAEYELSQKTTTRDDGRGGVSQTQTLSERLSAVFKRSTRPDGMLDVRQDHDTTRIDDRSTVTTLAEATADRVVRVLRRTDEQKLKTFTRISGQHVAYEQSRPSARSFVERLFQEGVHDRSRR